MDVQFGGGFSDAEGVRTRFVAPELAPAGIILDAELTLATPEWLWSVHLSHKVSHILTMHISASRLSTGMRAVDHAVGE